MSMDDNQPKLKTFGQKKKTSKQQAPPLSNNYRAIESIKLQTKINSKWIQKQQTPTQQPILNLDHLLYYTTLYVEILKYWSM